MSVSLAALSPAPPPPVPWHVFTSPAAKWAEQPSFVVGEFLFIACALAALLHALSQPRAGTAGAIDERRRHLLVWLAALLAGTANDLFFMALPLVDNFWHAQATVMLTARLPLYIPCVYVSFMYFPTVATWRLGLPPVARAATSALAAIVFYAPFDIVGAKFLWWTWHDTDPAIANRLLGVPVGSSLWVITFVVGFAAILGRVVDRDPAVSRRSFGLGVLAAMALCTPLMMLSMIPLQVLDKGVPGPRGLVAIVGVLFLLAFSGLRRSSPVTPRASDRRLAAVLAGYFATLLAIVVAFDPSMHRSTSVHQTYGPCDVEAVDIGGRVRRQFLCANSFDEDFSFDCRPSLPTDGDRWYTLCGRPYRDFARWAGAVGALGVIGTLLYGFLLGAWRPRRWHSSAA